MACQDCNTPSISLTGTWFNGSPCSEDSDCQGAPISAACVVYNGPNLSCSGVNTLDSLELALQKIDEQICTAIGDYSTYNMHCLPTWWGAAITNQADFVDAITDYICELNETVEDFIDNTYAEDLAELTGRIEDLEVPGITCASASVTSTDTLQQVLTKYCTKFASIDTALSISGVTWNSCLTVVGTPSTLTQGFQLLADQICDVYELIGEGGLLPTFNNYSSCIGGTSDDSLVETIELIKDRLCILHTLDMDELTSDCIVIPDSGGNDLDFQDLIQNMLDGINLLQQNFVTFDEGDFIVSATDAGDPCAGITVSLASSLGVDRFVAVNASDSSPSTLVDKLTSAGSIVFDDSSNTDISLDINSKDYGDVTVSNSGNTWTVDNQAITFAKMQNINTASLLGRSTAGTGAVEQITIGSNLSLSGGVLNAQGRTLIGITVFTSSGTWTKPAGCNAVVVEMVAGGGGGGGASASAGEASVGSGGGAGAYALLYITSGLGSSESVSVGTGGAGGSSGTSYVGQNGGDSSFGGFATVEHGFGGTHLVSGVSLGIAPGGLGGDALGISGNIKNSSSGGYGDTVIRLSGSVVTDWGKGGSSMLGHADFSSVNAGRGAGGFGKGETDGASINGAAGSDGVVIVYEYS